MHNSTQRGIWRILKTLYLKQNNSKEIAPCEQQFNIGSKVRKRNCQGTSGKIENYLKVSKETQNFSSNYGSIVSIIRP